MREVASTTIKQADPEQITNKKRGEAMRMKMDDEMRREVSQRECCNDVEGHECRTSKEASQQASRKGFSVAYAMVSSSR